MSNFLVADSCINRIVSWMRQQAEPGADCHYPIRALNKQYGYDFWNDKTTCEGYAEALYRLNCVALNERYGENEGEDAHFQYTPALATSIQVLKSLRCWLYQCSEGEVPTTALYRYMDAISLELALHIVQSLSAYDAATWG